MHALTETVHFGSKLVQTVVIVMETAGRRPSDVFWLATLKHVRSITSGANGVVM